MVYGGVEYGQPEKSLISCGFARLDLFASTCFCLSWCVMAGFIGSNLVKRIYQEAPSATVIGIDNMNAYYDVALKEFSLNELAKYPTFTFVKGNIADKELITELFEKYKPSVVVNLAAQAGVRYSITNPDAYVESNLVGFSISLKHAAIARV